MPVDTEPRGRVGEVLGLLDEITEVARASEELFRGVEQVIGLSAGEVHVLLAVAHGTSPVREVARRIGELDDAAGVIIESLIGRVLGEVDYQAPGWASDSGRDRDQLATDRGRRQDSQ